jgi:branched-chain amino acid transport system substrate-binding protein
MTLVLPCSVVSQDQPVTIGLLLPDSTHTYLIDSAESAIGQANAAGGYRNRQFRLLVRTTEGFWGAGSKESVSLVYDNKVRAIIGSLDGRNAHLAEQVAAKSHLTYIETFATEPTLSQAFVPWFMRVVPNDNQQSTTILNQIREAGGGKIGVLSMETYDTRYAVGSLTKEVTRQTGTAPLVFEMGATCDSPERVIESVLSSDLDHLVVPFDADYMGELVAALAKADPDLHIYGTLHLTLGLERRGSSWKQYERVSMVAPQCNREIGGVLPDSRSAYLYDAVKMVINAIHQVGTGREAIAAYLSATEYSGGVTGSISFDAR